MLFDLRSRGRRRTVQAVYLGLAIILGGGLVLFGVGAGNGFGGLLNSFTGNASSSSKPVVSQAEKTALRATQLRPSDPQAWIALIQARDSAAKQNFDSTTGTVTAAGKKEFVGEIDAWQHYLKLTQKPDSTTAILAARAYSIVGNYPAPRPRGSTRRWLTRRRRTDISAWPRTPTRPSKSARATWPQPRRSAWRRRPPA